MIWYMEFMSFNFLYFQIIVSGFDGAGSSKTMECECGVPFMLRGRIVGGEEAEQAEFPWQIAIFVNGRVLCGGALINDRYALSAGHCFRNANPRTKKVSVTKLNKVRIFLGAHKIEKLTELNQKIHGTVDRLVEYVEIHPLFDPLTYKNDIALIKLDKPLEDYGFSILPVCLPSEDASFVNQIATISGWGATVEGQGAVKVLRKTKIQILDDRICKKKLRQYFFRDVMMCASSPGKDACQGDSGGPMILEDTDKKMIQIGVTSYGIGCADARYPGVYTEVSKYLDWILENTKDAFYCAY